MAKQKEYLGKSAVMSECGKYRYFLERDMREDASQGRRVALFVMLNPSTADARQDDPTIRRCVGFARRERCNVLQVVNVYGMRATKPEEVLGRADAVGKENGIFINRAARQAQLIIAAWGAMAKPADARSVMRLLVTWDKVHCLGKTKHRAPRHPLYVKADQPLVQYSLADIPKK